MFGFFFQESDSNPTKDLLTTVDGRNPANQLRLVVYPSSYEVL